MNVLQSSAMKNTENQNEWAKTSLQNFDRIIETLIKKNASLEERMKEMEMNFTILCITLIVSLSVVFIIFYI